MTLIFALMLQGMAVAVAAARSVAAGADPGWPGFQICQHNGTGEIGSNADADDATTPERSGAHCIFCLAAEPYTLEGSLPNIDFHVILRATAPWLFTAWRLPARTVDASARPRGPPPLV